MEGLLEKNLFGVSRPAHHILAFKECSIRPAKFHGPLDQAVAFDRNPSSKKKKIMTDIFVI